MPNIRPYCAQTDEAGTFALWQTTLGDQWAVDHDAFHQATTVHGGMGRFANFVAEDSGHIVGFVCAQQSRNESQAGMLCVLVAPDYQRRGIGRSLVWHVLDVLAKRGVRQVSVGCGGHAYFCPGVPVNLPGAKAFYESLDWRFEYLLYDMTLELDDFIFDERWLERPRTRGFEVGLLEAQRVAPLLAFERQHFPEWASAFEDYVVWGRLADIVVATDGLGEVVGAVTLITDQDDQYDNGLVWRAMLGDHVGGFGVLGVREDVQGNGIGLALAAEATRVLKERGVNISFVGWTYLEELYGRLGYRVWRRYHMSDMRML
jgi:beta-N-acetylhexosaminidase